MHRTTITFHKVEWGARSCPGLKDALLATSKTHDGGRGSSAPPFKVDTERATACNPRECPNRLSTLKGRGAGTALINFERGGRRASQLWEGRRRVRLIVTRLDRINFALTFDTQICGRQMS